MIKTKLMNGIILLAIFFSGALGSVEASTDIVQAVIPKVFKVISYDYNSSFGTYKAETLGSAVLVDDNMVVTNAHVVLDAKGEPYGNYEICKSNGLKELTSCFSLLKLVRYDSENDLALLEISDTITDTPVKFGTEDLSIGMNINVIGFPANGGDSVTVTRGSIAGYEKGFYKIDANLDGGNSGGGGFDDEGNLIGIPTFVSAGYTTLGYIIPMDVVNDFLNGKTGTKVTKAIAKSFSNYVDGVYKFKDGGSISNVKFTTPKIEDYDLNVVYASEQTEKGFYDYDLINADETVGIKIRSTQISAKMSAKEYAKLTLYRVKKEGGDGFLLTRKKDNKVTWFLVYDPNYGVYTYVQANSKNNSMVVVEVIDITEKGAPKADLRKAIAFTEGIIVRLSSEKNKAIPTPQITFSDIKDFFFVKSYDADGLYVNFYPSNKRFIGDMTYSKVAVNETGIGDVKDNLENLSTFLEDTYTEAGYTIKYTSIDKNSQNAYILILEIMDENKKPVTIANVLVKDSGNYLLSTIGFDLYSLRDSTYIKDYIKGIKITNPLQ